MIGTMLLHYRILNLLGKGGMGEVYLADDTKLNRKVALKVLPPSLRKDPDRLARFRQEAEAAAKLNHPNIAQIYALEETADFLFIAMEYVPGQPLSAHIPPEGLALDQFFPWFTPLAHAHERGVTHRDLKPGNIMISTEGIPKILDFGLAQLTRPDPEGAEEVDSEAETKSVHPPKAQAPPPRWLTKGGEILGTPAYMSPEQAKGQRTDHRFVVAQTAGEEQAATPVMTVVEQWVREFDLTP